MNPPLIWLHEEALRTTHPVFLSAPAGSRSIFIWDDGYFQKLDYSFKRLVFIYESLCELPVDIVHGDIISVIKEIAPSQLYVPASNKPHLLSMMNNLKSIANLHIIQDDDFVTIPTTTDLRRFFKYWTAAEKTAFRKNGDRDA